jgi:interferon gamma-inducible protein 30
MEFSMFPWGNAYYGTPPFDKTNGMFPWSIRCGVASPPKDCFVEDSVNQKLCQHGANECMVNLLEGCAKFLNPVWTTYMDFVTCLEDDAAPTSSASIQKCAASATVNGTAIQDCAANSTMAAQVSAASAYATAKLGTSKLGTPWVIVNGQVLEDPIKDLLPSVCKAWKGTAPAICP